MEESSEVMRGIGRGLWAVGVPGGVLLLAAAAFLRWAPPATVAALTNLYPYAVYAAGVLLGWRFHRSRVVFAVIALALADRALVHFGQGEAGRTLFAAVALLLPLNLAGFSLLSERGPWLRRWGLSLGAVGGQALVVALLSLLEPGTAARVLEFKFTDAAVVLRAGLPQPALFIFILAFLFLAVRSVLYRKAIGNGFLWALVAAFLGLRTSGTPATIYLATGALILAVAVIEASYRLAYRDELTGLPGRRALNEALLQLGEEYAVAMADVDHFKKFNDTYGHEVGDQVLRMVGARLERVGGGGRAFRYGGEEFALLFAGKSVEEALPYLEAVREEIERSRFALRGGDRPRRKPQKPRARSVPRKDVSVTVSLGAAEPTRKAPTPGEVLLAADKALYRAKKAGRNQVKT